VARKLIEENLDFITRIGTLTNSVCQPDLSARMAARCAPRLVRSSRHFTQTEDKEGELVRLKKEIERLAKDIDSKQSRLADDSFLAKAPVKVVEDLRAC